MSLTSRFRLLSRGSLVGFFHGFQRQILLFHNPFFLISTKAHQRKDDVDLIEKDGGIDEDKEDIGIEQNERVHLGLGSFAPPRAPVSWINHGGAAGGIALSVLAVMPKEPKKSYYQARLVHPFASQPCAVQDSGIRPRNSD